MATGILTAYIVLLVVGGWLGYSKAGSKVSLGASLGAGAVLALCALQIIPQSLVVARVILGLLLVVFAIRLAKTRKFMPAGLLVALTGVTLVLHLTLA